MAEAAVLLGARPSAAMPAKARIDELALFGGARLFPAPRSTSNLVRPDFARFIGYADPLFSGDGGPAIIALMERRFAAFHGVPHCIAFANGFWALVSAIKALAL